MMTLFFRDVLVCSEDQDPVLSNVLIEEGRYKAVGVDLSVPEGAEVIEGNGKKLLMPAMFDTHVHFREPGQEHKEDIATGSEAAINGGITGIVMMPNTAPAIDSAGMVNQVLNKAKEVSRIPIYTSGCVTKGRAGKEMAAIQEMVEAGVVMITDDGDTVGDPAMLKRAMEYASEFDVFFASHCETPEFMGPRALNEGRKSYELGIQGSPAISEEICMDRDIRIAHATGTHIHIQHVSSGIGMKTIKWWKEMGAKVTGEVSPHHLIFNEMDIGDFDTNFKMNPPLRTAEDNALLLEGLKEGVFDIIATDHAPHTEVEKTTVDFVNAPNGITGLETALVSLYDKFIVEKKLDWKTIVKRFSAEPRRMMRLAPAPIEVGAKVDCLLFDSESSTTFSKDFFKSKSTNSPFIDKTLKGEVQMVLLDSEVLKK